MHRPHNPDEADEKKKRVFTMKWLLALAFLLTAPAPWAADLKARGVVVARHRAVLAGEIAARVLSLPHREGESFATGETLVAFDCRMFEAQREKVRAEYQIAQKKLENSQKLFSTRAIGTLELSLAEAETAAAAAEVSMAELNVQRCTISAPYDGRVVRVMANEHDSTRQQQEILEIVALNSLEMEIIIPGTWLTWLRPGTPLTVQVDETGASVPATLKTLGAAVDAISQTVKVRATLDGRDGRLLPGMSGSVRFIRPPKAP